MKYFRPRSSLVLATVLIFLIWILSPHGRSKLEYASQPVNRPTVPADWSKGSLRDRLLAHFKPEASQTGIPREIWQSWKSKENLDVRFQENVKRWSSQSKFNYHFLDDEEINEFVRTNFKSFPEILQAWDIFPRKILRADYFRYLVLVAKGGYYSDIDTSPSSDLDDWLTQGHIGALMAANDVSKADVGVIIGIEEDMDLGTWRGLLNRRINLCQWTLASRPGHPLFVDIVAKIADLTLNYYDPVTNVLTFPMGYKNLFNMQPSYNMSKDSANWYEGIIEWTGPAAFTDSFFQTINRWYTENFSDRLEGFEQDSLCNSNNACILDPNKSLDLVSKLQNYPLGDNLLGIKLPKSPIGWENFTTIEYPVIYGEVALLPKHYFNSLYATEDKKGYIHHAFTGTWKWTQDP
ncbi:unnamed protein product [Kluyveromyces dobzhanskii CBS 2104]|uniref:WGS project CCBQ000000000 data, contig MAT n=1 Tax=Kluyveromyces dobzhanskii CBS 2104 TaxID=1427455 RepID=A0A0A8L3Z5_9SACH|nr:unnamed protein product [Kluyveromyces dobzhanskii CBS 2104]